MLSMHIFSRSSSDKLTFAYTELQILASHRSCILIGFISWTNMARSLMTNTCVAVAACCLLTGTHAAFVMLGDSFSDDGHGASPVVQDALSQRGVSCCIDCRSLAVYAHASNDLEYVGPASTEHSCIQSMLKLLSCSSEPVHSQQLPTMRLGFPTAAFGSKLLQLPSELSSRISQLETPSLVPMARLLETSWCSPHTRISPANLRCWCRLPWTRWEILHLLELGLQLCCNMAHPDCFTCTCMVISISLLMLSSWFSCCLLACRFRHTYTNTMVLPTQPTPTSSSSVPMTT